MGTGIPRRGSVMVDPFALYLSMLEAWGIVLSPTEAQEQASVAPGGTRVIWTMGPGGYLRGVGG